MSDKLEQICGYLLREGIPHYGLDDVATFKVIGPVPLDMSGNPSSPPRNESKYFYGRYLDVVATVAPSLCSYWSSDNQIPKLEQDGYIERIQVSGAVSTRSNIRRINPGLEEQVRARLGSYQPRQR